MTRGEWAVGNGVFVGLLSACIGVWTENPNWALNFPIGLVAGGAFGLATWPSIRWLRGL